MAAAAQATTAGSRQAKTHSAPAAAAGKAAAGKKRQHFSRNKKRNIRSKVDMSEVEDALDDQRHDERTGGPMSLRSDKQLFTIDKGEESGTPAPTLSRKARAAAKVLKTVAMLQPVSAVKPVATRVAPTVRPSSKPGPKPNKEIRKRAYSDPEPAEAPEWADGQEDRPEGHDDPWLQHLYPPPKRQRTETRQPEPSAASAVEVPVGGTSYNPADEDHQALLSQALTREQQRLAEKERIEKGLPKQLSATKRHQLWLEEAKIVDADGDDDDDGDALAITDGDAEQGDGASSVALVRSVRAENRKTKQQRATELRLKREAEARAASKQQRIIDNDVFEAKALKRRLAEEEQERARHARKLKERKEKLKLSRPRVMSSQRYEAPDPTLLLTDELPQSLRQLKPEGNLIAERLDSMRRRNLLEHRTPTRIRRKYPLKVYERRTYKNFREQEAIKAKEKAKKAAKSVAK